jgi:hypothetical protein
MGLDKWAIRSHDLLSRIASAHEVLGRELVCVAVDLVCLLRNENREADLMRRLHTLLLALSDVRA